ncbi:carbohydrate ABC transporter permease [Paenibacillus psychroresistens]|uniref:Carbohydrate ABC transporter permease n=1 Tax=Paenibacillus psychroresistens TaxID=1778678 RepID=A0A6B8RQ05_9BACL|nr:carbohydrate ABC transporter permease [Paenibacillus psychroresistens]QGQ97593.1 carbohydrate ABC transporter permease [Paenibacillus psychroresistens]
MVKSTKSEKTFDLFNIILMISICLLTIYPFWYVFVTSLNEGADAAQGPIWLWPRAFTLDNYKYVMAYDTLFSAFTVTVARCIIGSVFSVGVCLLAAYALSKRHLPGRKVILYYLIMPMFIGGSLISNYIVIAKLGLINNFMVYILPSAFIFFSMIIIRTFIEQVPLEIEESAMIDGANYWKIFVKIIVPLSKPIIAAFLFFTVVSGWLDLTTTLLYVTKEKLFTLQYVLYNALTSSSTTYMVDASTMEDLRRSFSRGTVPTPQVIQMTVMVIVTFPLLFIYPFFQRYFVSGMMLGSVKA